MTPPLPLAELRCEEARRDSAISTGLWIGPLGISVGIVAVKIGHGVEWAAVGLIWGLLVGGLIRGRNRPLPPR